MKRFLFYLLISFSLFSIASCGDDDDDDSKQTTPSNNDSNATPNSGNDTNNDKPAPVETKTFTVTFNTDGGSEVAAQTVEDGKSATKPENPSKEGFWFLGWYVGENGYEFTQPVSDDLTVTAKWMEKTEYDVDLGLPSGTIWASCNVGAQNPWDYGDYFSWGEVTTKDVYDEDTYTYRDSPSTLDASHDAATVNMGSNWRMPTVAEFVELRDNCEWEWTDDYNGKGVSGYIVWDTYFHKTHIFLPAAGDRDGTDLYGAGFGGYYWSGTQFEDDADGAYCLDFTSGYVDPDCWDGRQCGRSVRPVRCR